MVNKMKTTERVLNALQRVKELLGLVADWTRQPKEEDTLTKEFREKKFYINSSEKLNYIFNSSIKGIEESDLILLIGSNPRHEATMLNARIRKTFVKKRIPIFSIGDPGDLTYEYTKIGNKTDDLKDIINEKGEFYNKLSSAKKPIIIAVYLLQLTCSFKNITAPIVRRNGAVKIILYKVVKGK